MPDLLSEAGIGGQFHGSLLSQRNVVDADEAVVDPVEQEHDGEQDGAQSGG